MKALVSIFCASAVSISFAAANPMKVFCPATSTLNNRGPQDEWKSVEGTEYLGSLDHQVSAMLMRGDETRLRCHYTPDTTEPYSRVYAVERILDAPTIITSENYSIRESNSLISDCISWYPSECGISLEY